MIAPKVLTNERRAFVCMNACVVTVDSRYSGPLKYGPLKYGPLKYGHLDNYTGHYFGLAQNASYYYVYCTKLTLKYGHSLFRIPASAGCPKQGFQCNLYAYYGWI